MFGQMYDDMNHERLHIVYSPIFGQVPLRPELANALANALDVAPDGLDVALANALANDPNNVPLNNGFVVQNGDGLNNADIDYFRKQTIKHIMTQNMLKYHYEKINENT